MTIEKAWRKSTKSGAGNACVEVLITETDTGIRDSKAPKSGSLTVSSVAWRQYIGAVRADGLT